MFLHFKNANPLFHKDEKKMYTKMSSVHGSSVLTYCERIYSIGEVPQRTSSHLATIVSRALQPQDGRIPCPVDRNLEIFITSHIDFLFTFGQCGDNCKLNLF